MLGIGELRKTPFSGEQTQILQLKGMSRNVEMEPKDIRRIIFLW